LALVTYEGERIYGYQLVTLKKGDNAVKVPLTSSLAPTFRFSIALMDGDQFHLATKWFSVEHELRVKIKTERVVATRAAEPRPKQPIIGPAIKCAPQLKRPIKMANPSPPN
jgi:hypothetical protein